MKPHPQMERIAAVLTKAHHRRGHAAMLAPGDRAALNGDGVEWRNPLTELMEHEEACGKELEEEASGIGQRMLDGLRARMPASELKAEVFEFITRQVGAVAFEMFERYHGQFIEWLFGEGPDPLAVVKRLFCYTKHKRADLLLDMGYRALGELLGEGGGANAGATMHARCRALFGDVPTGWKKTDTARRAMQASAMGNKNRRNGARFRKKTKAKK